MTNTQNRVPEKPVLEGLEAAWSARWEEQGTYLFDRSKTREQIYSIDTPPPTVSGSLHVGHVFSYTHTDLMARYKRMRGLEVFYPMGWDDNGLPTVAAVRSGLHSPREARREEADPDQPTQLHRTVQRTGATGRERVRGAVAHARTLG